MSISPGTYIKLEQHVLTGNAADMTINKELVPWLVISYDGVSSYFIFRNGEYRIIHRDHILEIMPAHWQPDAAGINWELDTLLNEYAMEGPSQEKLTQWLHRYPQYKRELTQFTVDWAILQAQEQEREQHGSNQVDEAVVQRGMAIVRGILQEQNILLQVERAIVQERKQRDYQVVVGRPRETMHIAGVPLPAKLHAYVATTVCTAPHENGIQCLWVDWAIHLPDGTFRVVLQNDLLQPGMPQKLFDQLR